MQTIRERHMNAIEKYEQQCLPEFSHINHYWDSQRKSVVTKILPGEFFVTCTEGIIATTLGSCISACLWDESAGVGGMNHFMLPLTSQEEEDVNWGNRRTVSDATRYGNFAMEHLINYLLKYGGQKSRFKAKVFGGGKVLANMSDVGERNIKFVLGYLAKEEIEIVTSDLGLEFPRKVLFEPQTGRAYIKRLHNIHNDTIITREVDYGTLINKDPLEGDIELF